MLETILKFIPIQDLFVVAVMLPFVSALANGVIFFVSFLKRDSEPKAVVSFIGTIVPFISLSIIILVWYVLMGLEGTSSSLITGDLWSWNGFLGHQITFGFKADPLSISLGSVVAMIFAFGGLYSVGYFSRERSLATYYSAMNLILGFALTLIFTDSILLFFIVYQLIALTSFVFIARLSSKGEAHPVARSYLTAQLISSGAFLFVMFLIWKTYIATGYRLDVFKFDSLLIVAPYLVENAHLVSAFLIGVAILGALQFPLYLWLPGTAKAPLPSFLLIFSVAAVVVSAYLLIRLNFIMILSPQISIALAYIGAVATVFGALSAISQKSAKRLVAYLVISNMGLAFMAIGVGAFSTAVFQIMMYVISVGAVLFGIGSVIYVCGSDVADEVGGLRKLLPVTFWTLLFGALSFVGVYPFAGFYAKNGVLWEVYQRGFGLMFLLGLIGMMIAAIAVFRMISLIFYGKMERSRIADKKIEESSVSMLVTQLIFAFAVFVGGWISVSKAYGGADHLREWLGEDLVTQTVGVIGEKGKFSEMILAVVVTLLVVHAAILSWIVFVQKRKWAGSIAKKFPRLTTLLNNGFYINRIYSVVLVSPLEWISKNFIEKGVDETFISGVVFGFPSRFTGLMADVSARVKNVNAYMLAMLLIVVLVLALFFAIL